MSDIATFLVPVYISSATPEELTMVSLEIEEAIQAKGLELAGDVKPWARPTVPLASPAGGFTSLS